ncbi:MAG: glycosyltransferase [Prevotella sp.]|nr:glycosyltransferase [Prevotella sp.]
METRLTIIIPIYRVSNTMDRCVDSIVRQQCDGMEIILVDDGSPDDCPKKCDRWAERDCRIKVIHKENGGLSDARNAGLDIARGRYITFADSDDYIGDDTYAELMDIMDTHQEYDILEYPVCRISKTAQQHIIGFEERTYSAPIDYWMESQAYNHSYAWNKIYRRQMFDNVRYPVGRVFEDVATLPQLLKCAKCIATTPKGMYYYCDNVNGITARARGEEWRMFLDSHLNMIDRCREHPLFHQYYMQVVNIQLYEYELTGDKPRLKRIAIKRFGGLGCIAKLKAIVINILGINALCKINKVIVKTTGRR